MTTTQTTELHSAEHYGWTYLSRFLGKCPSCKTTVRHTVTADQALPVAWEHFGLIASCVCGATARVMPVCGSHSAKKCDGRCLNAKRADCECSCNGANHGAGS